MTEQVGEIRWYDVGEFGVEGRPFTDTLSPYDRLPGRAQGKVREAVWNLSRSSAGMSCRFVTDAAEIRVRWTLGKEQLGMYHFAPSGYSGVDLYARDFGGKWRWAGMVKEIQYPTSEGVAINDMEPQHRLFMLYLPLYNNTLKIEIGVPGAASFEPVAPRTQKPVVFYGTSILHGACASRPGMAWPSILGRRLDVPIVNMGFSGNAQMEIEVAAFLAEIEAAIYVLDPLPNMTAPLIAERAEPFIRTLREAQPDTPILLIEDRTYGNAWLNKANQARNRTSRAAFQAAWERLAQGGMENLFYVHGEILLGTDGESTVDGSHPNDLGFMRQADFLEPHVRDALRAADLF